MSLQPTPWFDVHETSNVATLNILVFVSIAKFGVDCEEHQAKIKHGAYATIKVVYGKEYINKSD